jgi:uncharacterized protein YndB with AHSA1/START domain
MANRTAAAADAAARPSLTLTRRINAAPEKVYAAWVDPQKLSRWFGPSSVRPETVRATVDARPGGRYWISFDNERGEHHEVGGVYRELVPNSRLVFSWAWHSTPELESQVTVLLKADGGGTLLTLHHEQLFDVPARDAHEHGWVGTLDKLEAFIA